MAAEATAPVATEPGRYSFGARLRVEQHHINPMMARVWLNDMELTGNGGCLTSLEISFAGHEVTKATLTIAVEKLEVDAQTLVVLKAIVEAKHGV